MKHYHLFAVLLLYNHVVNCLRGDTKSVCQITRREKEIIYIGPNETREELTRSSVDVCCPGYTEIDERCEPVCVPKCMYGDCTEPNKCTCFDHYSGVLCDSKVCDPGYIGTNCDQPCPKNTYGQNCREECVCENGHCDPVSGNCECNVGWIGSSCDIECNCSNGNQYNSSNGKCECKVAPLGIYLPLSKINLEPTCEGNFWGPDCKNKCQCGQDICNKTNGECISNCNFGFYGDECDKICPCPKSGSTGCLRNTGQCICKSGWSGDMCERFNKCPPMKFGPSCDNTCLCVNDHTEACDQMTGQCKCKAKWYGEICNECLCQHGKCNSSEQCICNPGWRGELCNEKCSKGYYGIDCKQKLSDCPSGQFNSTTNRCISLITTRTFKNDEKKEDTVVMYQILLAVLGGIIVFIIIFITVTCCRDNRRKKRYISASRQSSRTTAKTTSEEMSSPSTPLYEEIPCNYSMNENQYNQLLHINVEPDYLIPNECSPPNYKDNVLYTPSPNDNGYHIILNKFESPYRSRNSNISGYDRVRYFPNNRQLGAETEIVALIETPQQTEIYSSKIDDRMTTRGPYNTKTQQSHLQSPSSTRNMFHQAEPLIFEMEIESNRPRYTPPPSRQIQNVRISHY